MSSIRDLINTFCPSGVVYKKLGSLGRRNKGTTITAGRMKQLHSDGASIRVFAGGKTIADVREEALPAKDVITEPSIIVKSRGHIGFEYYDKPFSHKNELWSYTILDRHISQKFIYYYLLTQTSQLQEIARATSVKLPQLSIGDTDNLIVPVPPIEVQQEIVNILDTFTQLEAELEAELEARKRQYEHYRFRLLDFDDVSSDAEWLALGDLLDYEQPGKYIVSSTEYSDAYAIPVLTAGQSFVLGRTDEAFGVFSASKSNPVIIFDDFTTSNHWVDFEFKVKSSAMKMLRPRANLDINFRYVFYAMQCIKYAPQDHARQWISKFSQFKIPVPTREVQNMIACTLDNFDSLVNDISEGLPAELVARRKQYEYYRGKLLTFKELEHA